VCIAGQPAIVISRAGAAAAAATAADHAMPDTARIVFLPSGRRGSVPVGGTVLEAARALGVDIDSVCGGRGICGRCQVTVGVEKGGAAADALSEPGATETDYRGRRPLDAGSRLSCAAAVFGDVVIHVPSESQVHRQVVRKRAEAVDIAVDPVVRLHYVEVEPAAMEDRASDATRLLRALEDEWGLTDLQVEPHVLADLQAALRRGDWSATTAVHDGNSVTAVWPGFHDQAFGVAFDVGSTTLAGHLCDLFTGEVRASAGRMNPQIRFGEDLMSRVSYSMMNEGGAAELTSAVRGALNDMVGELVETAGVDRTAVLEVTVVGNPIMHHLVLGIDPRELGVAPFALATDEAVRTRAAAIGLELNPGAGLYVLPCVAGHVGADAAAVALSEGPHRQDGVMLVVDVGTNAEILLGGRGRLLAASSPTGPAFEGAEISAGQRAAPGAIERVRIDPETLEPRVRVIGCELWSDEEGFAEAVSKHGITGICGSGIIEAVAQMYLAGIIDPQGVVGGEERSRRIQPDERTFRYVLVEGDNPIAVTQPDVRAVQLAKAALRAGVQLLMDHLGVDEVGEVRLAGAFGNHIDPIQAMILGLIPDCDPGRVYGAGNAAGTGAIMALLSNEARREVERFVRDVEKIETAVEDRFQEHFVDAMAIPHRTAPNPRLEEVVGLPDREQSGRANESRRARRRSTRDRKSE
jgi:uncharacterized 2Fe-2S/4Fe-4S cluster protein (DUF4445 family)